MTRLANDWAAAGHDLTIVTFASPGREPHYQLDAAIKRHDLDAVHGSENLWQGLRANGRRILRLRQALQAIKPDVVLSFVDQTNVLAILATRGTGIPIAVSERIHPAKHAIGRLWEQLRRLSYPLADAVVVQTADIAQWVSANIGRSAEIIPNPAPVIADGLKVVVSNPAERIEILAVGRLNRQKGFDILIEALSALPGNTPVWHATILGEGPERYALERQITSCGVEDRIALPGVVSDVAPFLAGADIFVMPSRFEGFPNALLEALAWRLPVVATDCPGGSAEILQQGRFGRLVPPDDARSLSTTLSSLMSDAEARAEFSGKSRLALEPFKPETISAVWIKLFETLRARRGGEGA